jgi:hypothetical protein
LPSLANWIIATVLPLIEEVSKGPSGVTSMGAMPAWKLRIAVATQAEDVAVETVRAAPASGVRSER